jgi:membrane protease YdiL (CAAX protease family)
MPPVYAGGTAIPETGENPVWSLWDVLAIAVFAFASFLAITFVALAVVGVIHTLPRFRAMNPDAIFKSVPFNLALETMSYVMVVASMVLIVAKKSTRGFFREIYWNTPDAGKAVAAIFGGITMTVMSLTLGFLLQRWTPKELPVESFFNTTTSAYAVAAFGIFVAPFVEELFFRGFLYPALARRIGVAASVVLTAIGFALLHQGQLGHAWAPLLVLFIVGTCLTIVRALTKSVAMTVLMHMSYNTTLFALMFLGTGGFRHMERLSTP